MIDSDTSFVSVEMQLVTRIKAISAKEKELREAQALQDEIAVIALRRKVLAAEMERLKDEDDRLSLATVELAGSAVFRNPDQMEQLRGELGGSSALKESLRDLFLQH